MQAAVVPELFTWVTAKGKVCQPTATGTVRVEESGKVTLTLPAVVQSAPSERWAV